jgi:pimeloyl-ACP methyl ester carboxylesterase
MNDHGITVRDVALPGGITLQCREAGLGRPQRVVLLHGFPEGAFIWDDTLRALAPRAHAIAPDQRGYGASSTPADVAAYRVKHLMADLVALIQHTGDGGPIDLLVAHDWGGAVAWNLAALAPQWLKHLLIVNSPHPATFLRELRHNPAQVAASQYMLELAAPGAADRLAADGFARLWQVFEQFGPAPWLTPALRQRYLAHWQRGLDGALNWYRASPMKPATGPEDAIHTLELPDAAVTQRVPTTVIWGERDHALLPGLVDGIERWIPDLRLVRVPEASHWLVHERPALVLQEIERALDRVATAGR